MANEFGALRDGPDRFAPGAQIIVSVTVLFPTTDIEPALEAMKAFNTAQGVNVSASTYSASQ